MLIDGITLTSSSEIQNIHVESGATFPVAPARGRAFYLTISEGGNDPGFYVFNGTTWTTGDITAVTAGNGLTGGGTGGSVSLVVDTAIIATRAYVDGATVNTSTNLAAGLGGSIPYQSAANKTVMLANGTAGQVLTSNGTTLAPTWVAAASGSDAGKLTTVDVISDFVVVGLLSPTSANLTSILSAGTAYANGTRVVVPATSFTYAASSDTYVDLSNTGVLTYVAVASSATAPAVTANSLRLQKVVTSATAITAVARISTLKLFKVDTAIRGSYGGGAVTTNFAAGDDALPVNTTGFQNTAIGVDTLLSNTTGFRNTAVGLSALQGNTTGSNNTASGVSALTNNTTGSGNTAIGKNALDSNTTGSSNAATGGQALLSNTTTVATFGAITGGTGYTANLAAVPATLSYVSGSTAISYPPVLITTNATGVVTAVTLVVAANGTSGGTGFKDITTVMSCTSIGAGTGFVISPATLVAGGNNAAIGFGALQSNTTGSNNTASGLNSLYSNTTGINNTAVGMDALLSNTTGAANAAIGKGALRSNTTGYRNTASGVSALLSNTTGYNNIASGVDALYWNTTGYNNTASGVSALKNNTTGHNNTASGVSALENNTSGSGNTALNPLNSDGTYAPVFDPVAENNRFCMGSTGVTNAYIKVAWTVVSDARDKTDFAPVPHGLDFVSKLKTTAYRYKMNREATEGHGPVRYGFKAQDVLALEGNNPVIVDAEDLEKLRFNDQALIAVMVNAIKELNAKFDAYVASHP